MMKVLDIKILPEIVHEIDETQEEYEKNLDFKGIKMKQ